MGGYRVCGIVCFRAVNHENHCICVYTRVENGVTFYGAVGKSNTTVLRGRDCVYLSLRELCMSYFDWYFNVDGEKCLQFYSDVIDPFDISLRLIVKRLIKILQ